MSKTMLRERIPMYCPVCNKKYLHVTGAKMHFGIEHPSLQMSNKEAAWVLRNPDRHTYIELLIAAWNYSPGRSKRLSNRPLRKRALKLMKRGDINEERY